MNGTIDYIEAKYIGQTCFSLENGKTYKAVGYEKSHNLVSIVDESNENYLYLPEIFEFAGDYMKLSQNFPDVYNNNGRLEYIDY